MWLPEIATTTWWLLAAFFYLLGSVINEEGLSKLLGALGFMTLATWFNVVFVYPFYISPMRDLPGPQDNVIFLGQSNKFLKTPWLPQLFCDWSRQFPTAPFIRYLNFGNTETLIANSITAYKEVLTTKSHLFVKPSFARRFAWEFIRDGLPFAEGAQHKFRRSVLSRLFSTPNLRKFVPQIHKKADQLVAVMKRQQMTHGAVELETPIWKAVLDIIGMETLGVDLNHLKSNQLSPLYQCFTATMNQSRFSHIVNYLNSIVPIRRILPFTECRDFARNIKEARKFIRRHIEARLESLKDGTITSLEASDGLSYMLKHRGPDSDNNELVEYVYNLLVLGHDTTACSLLWAIFEISRRPRDQARLYQEVLDMHRTGQEPTYDNIEKMPFLNMFVLEVLRLWCPVALAPREATCDVTIDNVFIPRGTVVQLSPAVVNTHPLIWGKDADKFDTRRWDHVAGPESNALAFQTFHWGPRMCIGRQLAIIEMKVFLVHIIANFWIAPLEGGAGIEVDIASPTFTLKPKDKLTFKLRER